MMRRTLKAAALSLLALPLASAALAHTGHDATASLGGGLAHPFGGIDHLLAMLAVGIWAVQAGGRSLWALPGTFVAALLAGAALGLAASSLPVVETGIAASLALLGTAIFFGAKLPLWAGMAAVAAFGAVHGFAHGTEVPAVGSALAYFGGMALASILLHSTGIAFAVMARRGIARHGVRPAGAVLAGVGVLMLSGVF
jgi:urease accessory protein